VLVTVWRVQVVTPTVQGEHVVSTTVQPVTQPIRQPIYQQNYDQVSFDESAAR